MSANHLHLGAQGPGVGATTALEERLERGDIVYYPACPFSIPEGDNRHFLLEQRLASRAHKNISFDPIKGRLGGHAKSSGEQSKRLHDLFDSFSKSATDWLGRTFPRYSQHWALDRVSYRPEEEATRLLRQKARNDLLHVDAFPSRPTNGHRILRLFVNVNPIDPRIWVTSDPFAKLLEKYGSEAGLPVAQRLALVQRFQDGVLKLFRPGRKSRSVYDSFMLRFHDFLKANEKFQERGPKRFWSFPPNSAWVVFTDAASHAVLRGRYALEHSYFVAPEGLALPQESPPVLLAKACGFGVLDKQAA